MRAALSLILAFSGCRCAAPSFGADEAALICATLQTCSPGEFSATFGNSLEACTTTPSPILPWPGSTEREPVFATGLEQPFRELYRCLLDAHGDCAKAGACWALDGDVGSCTNRYGILNGFCDGETLSGCNLDGQRFEVDCGRYSSTCTNLNFLGNFNVCARAKCSAPPTCQGNQAELCSGNTLVLLDCSRSGRTCERLSDGGVACVVGNETCDPRVGRRCEGSVAVSCEGLGFAVRTDCALNPTHRRCEAGECVDTGKECHAAAPSCEGSVITFCQDGFLRKVDCVSSGFGTCDAGACTPK